MEEICRIVEKKHTMEEICRMVCGIMNTVKAEHLGKTLNECGVEVFSRNELITTYNENATDNLTKKPMTELMDRLAKSSIDGNVEINNMISQIVNDPLIDDVNNRINQMTHEDLKIISNQIIELVPKIMRQVGYDDDYDSETNKVVCNLIGSMWYNREQKNISCMNCDRPIINENETPIVRFLHEEKNLEITWNCPCLKDISEDTMRGMITRKFISLDKTLTDSEKNQYREILYFNVSILSEDDSKKIMIHFEQKFTDQKSMDFKDLIFSYLIPRNILRIKG